MFWNIIVALTTQVYHDSYILENDFADRVLRPISHSICINYISISIKISILKRNVCFLI